MEFLLLFICDKTLSHFVIKNAEVILLVCLKYGFGCPNKIGSLSPDRAPDSNF